MKLHADLSQAALVHAGRMPWSPSPTTGIERRMLFRLGDERASMLATAAQVYFFARLTHYLVYGAGVPIARTLTYFVGIGATLVALATLVA